MEKKEIQKDIKRESKKQIRERESEWSQVHLHLIPTPKPFTMTLKPNFGQLKKKFLLTEHN